MLNHQKEPKTQIETLTLKDSKVIAKMDLQAVKLDVLQKIMSISKASLLEKIDKLLEDELIVGYTVEGQPLTKASYNLRLAEAEEQLRSGNYTTQEDLEKESENW